MAGETTVTADEKKRVWCYFASLKVSPSNHCVFNFPIMSREHEHGLYFLLSFTPLPIYPQDAAPCEHALNLYLIQLH